MNKIDPVVKKETKYIALWVLLLSVLGEAVVLVIGKWDYTVLLGNLLGAGVAVLNFLLMGLTVQKALTKTDEKEAKTAIKTSQIYRFLFLIIVVILGVVIPVFNMWAVLVPMFFPRIAIIFRPFFDKNKA